MSTHQISAPVAAIFGDILSRVGAGFAAVGRAIVYNRGMEARLDEVRRLQALSDEELAKRGIARDDIMRHVFAGLFAA